VIKYKEKEKELVDEKIKEGKEGKNRKIRK